MATSPAIVEQTVSRRAAAIPALEPIYKLVAEDFRAVNALIPARLSSSVDLVEEISHHIVASGGKRLRPLLVLLAARSLNYQGREHVKLAAIIEFLHTATLLHDDVVDHSSLRRGQSTANSLWGNAPSVLVGDFLYSRAFQLMVELNRMPVMAILSDATNTIAEGEVLQLSNVGNTDLDEAKYREVIRCKTALLFEAATHTGAVLAEGDQAQTRALQTFGLEFGLAYQLVDDWLDYAGDPEVMGKNAGDDLAEGKLTLPLITALRRAGKSDADLIRKALNARSAEHFDTVRGIVSASGALTYTRNAAQRAAHDAMTALDLLPDSPYRDAMQQLTRFSVARLS